MPHNHQQCIDQAMKCAIGLCEKRGLRFTAVRRKVLELIWRNHQAVKAYDLLEDLKNEMPSAKPPTIYRALDFLLEQGLIHRVETLNAFIGCNHAQADHQLMLLICERCNNVEELQADALVKAANQATSKTGFQPNRRIFEIQGLCTHCRSSG